jgi:hypothetical protein
MVAVLVAGAYDPRMAVLNGSGFAPGESVDVRQLGQRLSPDRGTSDQAPVAQAVVADPVGEVSVEVGAMDDRGRSGSSTRERRLDARSRRGPG